MGSKFFLFKEDVFSNNFDIFASPEAVSIPLLNLESHTFKTRITNALSQKDGKNISEATEEML